MFTMRARENQSACSVTTEPMRLSSPASTTTATSGSSAGLRRTRSIPGQEGEERRWRIDAHHLGLLAEALGRHGDRERGTQGVAVGVLVTEGGDALGTAQDLGDVEHQSSASSDEGSAGFPARARR